MKIDIKIIGFLIGIANYVLYMFLFYLVTTAFPVDFTMNKALVVASIAWLLLPPVIKLKTND